MLNFVFEFFVQLWILKAIERWWSIKTGPPVTSAWDSFSCSLEIVWLMMQLIFNVDQSAELKQTKSTPSPVRF